MRNDPVSDDCFAEKADVEELISAIEARCQEGV